MVEENSTNKFKAGEFKGRVETLIEEMGKDIEEIKNSLKTLNECVVNMKIKMAGIGAAVSLAVTLLVLLFKEIIAK